MKFIKDIMSRKSKDEAPAEVAAFEDVVGYPEAVTPEPYDLPKSAKIQVHEEAQAPQEIPQPAPVPQNTVVDDADDVLEKLTSRLNGDGPKAAVNIWDIEDENDTVEAAAPVAAPSGRRRRNKTRVLGFNEDSDVVSMFESAEKAEVAKRSQFPVGWILIDDGPGRGECFTLEAGMSQIGRGDDQAIQLDFGDNSISRSNHAAIVYDTETHEFSLGHGGKKNIVRLNGKPVISNETLSLGDKIKIGETILHFVPLCSEEFNWADKGDTEESENVAIA